MSMSCLSRYYCFLLGHFLFPFRLPAFQAPSEKGSPLKGQNLLPRGANSVLLEKTLFGRVKNNLDSVTSPGSVSVPLQRTSRDSRH